MVLLCGVAKKKTRALLFRLLALRVDQGRVQGHILGTLKKD